MPAPPRRPATSRRRGIPEATVARLPVYLRALSALADERRRPRSPPRSSPTAAGVNSAKLRKDLSYLGSYGTRGVGYDVEYLVYQISRELGLTQDWPVVIVGIGNLGHALANYGGFASRGFAIVALLDADPRRSAQPVAGLHGRATRRARGASSRDHGVAIGVIATPAAVAQEVCDRLVAAGVSSILNFAPTVLVRARRASRSARSTCPSSCRSSPSTSSARSAGALEPAPTELATGAERRVVTHEPPRRRPVPPHRAGRPARAGRARPRDAVDKLLARRGRAATHVGEALVLVDLQPGRGLRRGRQVPRRRRRASPRCSPASAGVTVDELTPHLYVHYEDRAVAHLFSVACGLDSMVVGESQILGQVRDALRAGAGRWAPPAPALNELAPAGAAGRQAGAHRDRHRPGRAVAGRPSALDAAERVLGPLDGPRVLVVGAGSMSALAATAVAQPGRRRGRRRQPHPRPRASGWPPRSAARPSRSTDCPTRWPTPTSSSPAPARSGTSSPPTTVAAGACAHRTGRPLVVARPGAAARRRPAAATSCPA